MYKHLLFFGLLLICKNNFGQVPGDWGAFNQRIDATPYLGKNFKLEAAVKVKIIDSSAEGEIWTRVDKTDNKM